MLGYSSPEKHPRISAEEKNYLLMSCNKDSNDKIVKHVPWKDILLSKKVNALWVTHMCSAWGYYLLAISLPTFLEEVLNLTVINVIKCTICIQFVSSDLNQFVELVHYLKRLSNILSLN